MRDSLDMIKLVITDLDNTVYNWVDYYVPCFNAMLHELVKITGIDTQTLKESFKRVHQKHRTTEYAFAIEELDVLSGVDCGLTVPEILRKYFIAIDAFRKLRRKTLCLYEGVLETLQELRQRGITIIGHTDAMIFYAVYRLKQLKVENLFDGIVALKDHGLPEGTNPDDVRFYKEAEKYETLIPYKKELEPDAIKPNPQSLEEIVHDFNVNSHEAVYVGDSLNKDIYMAQKCGIHDVLAVYGRDFDPDNYRQLVEITHWTDNDVLRELNLKKENILPSHKISRFSELLTVIGIIEGSQNRAFPCEQDRF